MGGPLAPCGIVSLRASTARTTMPEKRPRVGSSAKGRASSSGAEEEGDGLATVASPPRGTGTSPAPRPVTGRRPTPSVGRGGRPRPSPGPTTTPRGVAGLEGLTEVAPTVSGKTSPGPGRGGVTAVTGGALPGPSGRRAISAASGVPTA